MTDSKVIDVYVRLGVGNDEDSRILSFKRPEEIPQSEALKKGFAIDGNNYAISVEGTAADLNGDEYYVPLTDNLRQAQLELVSWLEAYGYQVNFK